MIYYVSTPALGQIDDLKSLGFRFLGCHTHRRSPVEPYALDSGAWHYYSQQKQSDWSSYLRFVERWGSAADFCVLPDVVQDWPATRQLAGQFLERSIPRPYVAVQDGARQADLDDWSLAGVFEWKWKTAARWSRYARERGIACHVARVNSLHKIRLCRAIGATSADGTCLVINYLATRTDDLARSFRMAMDEEISGYLFTGCES